MVAFQYIEGVYIEIILCITIDALVQLYSSCSPTKNPRTPPVWTMISSSIGNNQAAFAPLIEAISDDDIVTGDHNGNSNNNNNIDNLKRSNSSGFLRLDNYEADALEPDEDFFMSNNTPSRPASITKLRRENNVERVELDKTPI